MSRASEGHCNRGCKAPRCLGLSKKTEYNRRCCLCTKHESNVCHHHRKLDEKRNILMVPTIKARTFADAAVVGSGVEVKESTIAGGGNGLFATIPFAKGDVITEYAGKELSRAEARRAKVQTHILHVRDSGAYIDGIRQKGRAKGKGGASFANHARQTDTNSKIDVAGGGPFMNRAFLRATKVVKPGEEIFHFYGPETGKSWRVAMGLERMD